MAAETESARIAETLAVVRDSIAHLYDVHDHLFTIDKKGKVDLIKKLQVEVLSQIEGLNSEHMSLGVSARTHLIDVCRHLKALTGNRLKRRSCTCFTAAPWMR